MNILFGLKNDLNFQILEQTSPSAFNIDSCLELDPIDRMRLYKFRGDRIRGEYVSFLFMDIAGDTYVA